MLVCDQIASRHSVRRFSPVPLGRSAIDSIIDAGLLSPSSKNRQPWEMIVLDSHERITDLSSRLASIVDGIEASGTSLGTTSESVRIMGEAPCIIFIGYRNSNPGAMLDGLTDREFVDTLSLGACIENMCIQATSQGIGSLWVCDILNCIDAVKEYLDTDLEIIACLLLGKAEGEVPQSSRRARSESVKYVPERGDTEQQFLPARIDGIDMEIPCEGGVFRIPGGSVVDIGSLSDQCEAEPTITVEGCLSLDAADFNVLTVRGVRFSGEIDLERCLFNGPVRFTNCRFKRINMALAKFNGPLLLGWCSTPDERIETICLKDAKFNFTKIQGQHVGRIDMSGTHISQTCSLRGSYFDELNLEGSTIEGELDIRGCEFDRLRLEDLCLLGRIGEDWDSIRDSKQATAKDIRRWKRILSNGVSSVDTMVEIMRPGNDGSAAGGIRCSEDRIATGDVSAADIVSDFGDYIGHRRKESLSAFATLKTNMNDAGHYRLEDEAYVELKRMERIGRNPFGRFLSWLADVTGGYGTNPVNTLGSIGVLILLFAAMFLISGSITGDFLGANPSSV